MFGESNMMSKSRSRFLYAASGVVVIIAGLIVHSSVLPITPPLRKYVGDALWATVVFFGFGFLLNKASTAAIASSAFCFASAIEFSQLYHPPWLDSVRATPFGVFVLGSTFNWPDFIAYAFGILLGVLVEMFLTRRQSTLC